MNYFKISKFFLYLAPFAIVIISTSTLFPFIVGKYVWFRTVIDLALIFFLLGILLDSYRTSELKIYESLSKIVRNPLVIAVTLFAAVFILAGFFGIDQANSFWSNFERGEGGLQILHLWLFFTLAVILFRNEKDWHKLFWIFIIVGAYMAFYGFGAGLKYVDAEWTTVTQNGAPTQVLSGQGGALYQTFKGFIGPQLSERFHGTLGNPAYVATFSIFLLFYTAYLYFSKYYQKLFSWQSILLYIFSIIFLVIFWLAATRGAFMGLIATIIAFLFYFVYSKKAYRKWLFLAIALIILIVGAMIYFKDNSLIKSLPGSRLFDISLKAETWEHRTYMWNMAWDGFKERPLLGWGPENYINVFDRHFDIRYFSPEKGFGAWFDRAHSIYFDYLVETGILGLLSFVGIWIVFYWRSLKELVSNNLQSISENFKQKRDNKEYLSDDRSLLIQRALIFALPISYLVQGIVLFDILPIYINIFIFLALAAYKFEIKN
ncbi:MAG: O-antigen ligase family protein [Patescibacteria group bacterium]